MKRALLLLLFFCSTSLFAAPRLYSTSVEDHASNSFSFSFYKDNYSYTDPNLMFERTYRDGADSNFPFLLLFQFAYPLLNSWIDFGVEANFGFGYNSGHGTFSDDGSESETRMNLWTLPVEVGFILEIDLKYLIFSASAGPSLVGMIQNRSDFDPEDDGKNIRQFGYGYYATGRIKLNLNRIFTKNAFKLFSSYKATRLTLNLEVRHVDYSHFKDDISISGNSYGIGFSFDFY